MKEQKMNAETKLNLMAVRDSLREVTDKAPCGPRPDMHSTGTKATVTGTIFDNAGTANEIVVTLFSDNGREMPTIRKFNLATLVALALQAKFVE